MIILLFTLIFVYISKNQKKVILNDNNKKKCILKSLGDLNCEPEFEIISNNEENLITDTEEITTINTEDFKKNYLEFNNKINYSSTQNADVVDVINTKIHENVASGTQIKDIYDMMTSHNRK